jgi:hypothetical protein
MEPLSANIGKGTRITLVIHTPQAGPSNYNFGYKPAGPYKKFERSQITSLITKILVITRTTLAVKVPMVQIGNETARITRTRNRQECYLKNK